MISVIIPTYNRAHLIQRAVESVIAQIYNDWELIVIDDGSTDNTLDVMSKYISDNRIKYVRKENSGATHSRNVGVEIAKKEYITFLDSDDEAKPEWLSSFFEYIKNGDEIICCGFEYVDENGDFIKKLFPKNMGGISNNRTARFTNGGVFILKRELFLSIGGYDVNVRAGQHTEMAIRLFKIVEKKNIEIINIFISLIKVHVHKGEKIRSDDEAIYEGAKYVLNKHRDVFELNPIQYSNNLAIAAVSAIRLNKVKEGRKLFYKSWTLDRGNMKKLARLIISNTFYVKKAFKNPK